MNIQSTILFIYEAPIRQKSFSVKKNALSNIPRLSCPFPVSTMVMEKENRFRLTHSPNRRRHHESAMSVQVLSNVLATSVAVADKAGRIVREIMSRGDLGIVEKTGKNDLQTEADRSAQRCIVASLIRSLS